MNNTLVEILDLELIGENKFRGQSQDLGYPRVFGGQVLGQALVAASRTVENRAVHSLHAYFLRPGDASIPIDYEVDCIRDGRSFTTRRVVAYQKNKAIFNFAASYQIKEEGFNHQFDMPSVPPPEEVRSYGEMAQLVKDRLPPKLIENIREKIPIEIRPINPVNLLDPTVRPPKKYVWFKSREKLNDDLQLHKCILAYASDFELLGTSMLPHAVSFMQRDMQVASLDHALWFHQDFRIDDWLLYETDSPSASQGRGFNRGNIYTQDGLLVASVTQEGLIRKIK